MLPAYGLYTHIRANRIRTLYLLASFVGLLLAVAYSLALIYAAMQLPSAPAGAIFARAGRLFAQSWHWAVIGAGVWFAIAWMFHQKMIDFATGSEAIERHQAPKLYAALENLCISRGITMPALKIIETPGLNAFASGMREGQYSVSVTRGLMETLTPQELEAVLAHELTHIRNQDVRVLVVATIFAGIIAFVADIFARNWDFPFGYSPRRPSRDDDRRSGGGGAAIAIAVAIAVIAISWGLSVLIKFAISRKREFLADAGAVELTKNPDAMISALRKIERQAVIPDLPSRMSGFFIESPDLREESDWLSTHPTISSRVAALVQYAGGHDPGPISAEPMAQAEQAGERTADDAPEAVTRAHSGPDPASPWQRPRRWL